MDVVVKRDGEVSRDGRWVWEGEGKNRTQTIKIHIFMLLICL